MNVFKDDLFKNKYFLIIISVLAVIIGTAHLINYNSVESKCERYTQNLGSMLGTTRNKTTNLLLQNASSSLIQDCIKRGGPNSPSPSR